MTVADELQFNIALCIRNGAHARSGSWYVHLQTDLCPDPSSYSADTDTTMHFKAHCLSSGPFMIMQTAKKILAKVASDGGELSDHKASVAFCSITFHIQNVCFTTVLIVYTALLSTEGVSAFPGFLIFENFSVFVYLFNYHIMNKYLVFLKYVFQFM